METTCLIDMKRIEKIIEDEFLTTDEPGRTRISLLIGRLKDRIKVDYYYPGRTEEAIVDGFGRYYEDTIKYDETYNEHEALDYIDTWIRRINYDGRSGYELGKQERLSRAIRTIQVGIVEEDEAEELGVAFDEDSKEENSFFVYLGNDIIYDRLTQFEAERLEEKLYDLIGSKIEELYPNKKENENNEN